MQLYVISSPNAEEPSALPVEQEVAARFEETTVSVTVKSQLKLRQLRHGRRVSRSGLLPSVLE